MSGGMTMVFAVEIVTPERSFPAVDCDFALVPAFDGELGVLSRHAPLVALLGTGVLKLRQGEATHRFAIGGGVAQVANDRLTILAERAVDGCEVSAEKLQRELDQAEAGSANQAEVRWLRTLLAAAQC